MHLRRVLLLLGALILVVGAVMHTRGFDQTESAVATSNLPPFFASSLKALWLIDSMVLSIVAAILVVAAFRPAATSRTVLALVAVIPTATGVFLYKFLGNFPPAHLLLSAGLATLGAALSKPV